MGQLPRGADIVVAQYAESLGITAQQSSDGSYGFDFERAGRLSITPPSEGEGVIVSLTRRTILQGAVARLRFAALGGYDPVTDRMVQTGMTKAEQPVLAVTFDAQDLSYPALDATVAMLDARHASAER